MNYYLLLLVVTMVLANLPWFSSRCWFVFQCEHKPAWVRFAEWLILFFACGALAFGLEQRMMGTVHGQDWEFYVVAASIFFVLAVPGFIYRYIR